MHLEVLVEELSAEPIVRRVVEHTVPPSSTYDIRVFEGKTDLLGSLVERLRGYRTWQLPKLRIMVLVDRDDQDCVGLKHDLEQMALEAGLVTKRRADATFQVCNRIAVEELEAWLLGDEPALQAAFPRLRPFANKAAYRDPDAVTGGTWESVERLLQRVGYYEGGLRKTDLASRVAPHLDLSSNRSMSFNAFVSGLNALTTQ